MEHDDPTRENAVQIAKTHYVEGYLTVDEMEREITLALAGDPACGFLPVFRPFATETVLA